MPKQIYKAQDGQEFGTKKELQQYQQKLRYAITFRLAIKSRLERETPGKYAALDDASIKAMADFLIDDAAYFGYLLSQMAP